jgi:membrane-associated phospholipid phosphatase
MHDDKHWASDVFVGATVGILTTRGVYRARARRKSVTSATGFRLYYGDLTGYRWDGTSEAGLWRE